MNVLLLGASGFIGRHLAARLRREGHQVTGAVRRPIAADDVAADLVRDTAEDWVARLRGKDAVVNAAGIFREAREGGFAAVHDAGPRALFAACAAAGVRRVIQISALGADADAASRFHLSKQRADDALRSTALDWVVVQPSLVFGADGRSARQFAVLAALPLVPLPGDGEQRVQPIHVGDLCDLVLRLLEPGAPRQLTLAAVGPRPVTIREWLRELRRQMRLPASAMFQVPLALVRMAVGTEAVGMLVRGNTASPEAAARLLGGPLRDIGQFVPPEDAPALLARARLDWLLPILRAMVAVTWIATGILSLGVYPAQESLALLARVGLSGAGALAALYGAAALDLAFGIGIYALQKGRRWLWRAQLALILGYSVVIALFLPEFWLHPFGPLLKNLPLLAAILLLHEFEPRPWIT